MITTQQNETVARLAGWQYDQSTCMWLRKSNGALEERRTLPDFSANSLLWHIEQSMDRPMRTQYETVIGKMLGLRSQFFYIHCSGEDRVKALCEILKEKEK